jgi:hypothetical protein
METIWDQPCGYSPNQVHIPLPRRQARRMVPTQLRGMRHIDSHFCFGHRSSHRSPILVACNIICHTFVLNVKGFDVHATRNYAAANVPWPARCLVVLLIEDIKNTLYIIFSVFVPKRKSCSFLLESFGYDVLGTIFEIRSFGYINTRRLMMMMKFFIEVVFVSARHRRGAGPRAGQPPPLRHQRLLRMRLQG